MNLWTLGILVIAIAVGVFLIPFPVTGSTSFDVRVPTSASVSVEQIISYVATHDWAREFAAESIAVSATDLQRILSVLTSVAPEQNGQYVHYRIPIATKRPLVSPDISDLFGAMDYVGHSLQHEALVRGYFGIVDPETRRETAWKIFGGGFDARTSTFLRDEIPREPDNESRAFLTELRDALQARSIPEGG